MNEIVGTHIHAGDPNIAAKMLGMNKGMRRTDRAGKRLKTRRPLRDIADRAVGNDADEPSAL